jgi:hypothetical protein
VPRVAETFHLRGWLAAFAALSVLFAGTARGDVADGGAPADGGAAASAPPTAPVDAVDAAAGVGADAGPAPAPPLPSDLATPPDLAPPTTTATIATTTLVDAPASGEAAEPPRPITRRLWFWLAISGAVIAAVAIGIAVQSPTVNRPGCPTGYVCPP